MVKCWICGGEIEYFEKAAHFEFQATSFYVGAGCVPDFLSTKALQILLSDLLKLPGAMKHG